MATIALTLDDFAATIARPGIVLVDWWASWCGPCQSFAPVFEKASERHADVVFAKVDTDAEQALAARFQIRSIPMLMAFRDGLPVFSQPGAMPPAKLEEVIRTVRAIDVVALKKQLASLSK